MMIISRCKRFTREIYALEFCFLFICLINLFALAKTECNKLNERCQPLSECKALNEMSNIDYKSLNYCNRAQGIVCCQQIQLAPPPRPAQPENRPFQKDCRKWQQKVYPTCQPERLISGGKNAEAKQFPFMALVGILEDSSYDWFCGGSLISPNFVITAAHCIKAEGGRLPNRIRLGEVDYNSMNDNASIQEFTIRNFTVFPKYRVPEEYFDIALIELYGEAILNEYVAPICLPTTDGSEHDQLYAAGWGVKYFVGEKSTHLQYVKLDVYENQRCRKSAGREALSLPRGLNMTSQFCAGSDTDNRDTCQADSGGPIFFEHAYRACMFQIFGITSFGTPVCGTPGVPGVYTRILPYIDWIESIVWRNFV